MPASSGCLSSLAELGGFTEEGFCFGLNEFRCYCVWSCPYRLFELPYAFIFFAPSADGLLFFGTNPTEVRFPDPLSLSSMSFILPFDKSKVLFAPPWKALFLPTTPSFSAASDYASRLLYVKSRSNIWKPCPYELFRELLVKLVTFIKFSFVVYSKDFFNTLVGGLELTLV